MRLSNLGSQSFHVFSLSLQAKYGCQGSRSSKAVLLYGSFGCLRNKSISTKGSSSSLSLIFTKLFSDLLGYLICPQGVGMHQVLIISIANYLCSFRGTAVVIFGCKGVDKPKITKALKHARMKSQSPSTISNIER